MAGRYEINYASKDLTSPFLKLRHYGLKYEENRSSPEDLGRDKEFLIGTYMQS